MTLIRPGEGRRQEEEACCTCATLLSTISSRPPPPQDVSSEKQPLSDEDEDDQQLTGGDRKLLLHQQHHRLTCCARVICADCISKNPRFLTYCPYCQSSGRSLSSSSSPNNITRSLTPVLSDDTHPPPYSSLHLPPAYTPLSSSSSPPVPKLKQPPPQEEEEEDILHFLTPHDSIPSLSLLYNLPSSLLRSYNSLPTDSLLHARRTLLIPASHLPKGAISHSPRPYEGEEEEARKGKIRRWMVATKEHDYDIAVTYLEGAGYDFHEAVGRYSDDVRWERENPMRKGDVMKQGKRKVVRGLVGGLLGG